MLEDAQLEEALIIQAAEIGDKAIAAAGAVLSQQDRDQFIGRLGRQAVAMAAMRPAPDALERIASTNATCAIEMLKIIIGEYPNVP